MEVYKITNKLNGKIYIGSTKYTKEDRWLGHKKTCRAGDSRPLYSDMRLFGDSNFSLETIISVSDDTSRSELEKLEFSYIRQVPEDLRYNINYIDNFQSARQYYMTTGHIEFKEQRKGIYSAESYNKRRESRKYIYNYKQKQYRGINELHSALVLEGYELSKDQVKHLAQDGSFSKLNKQKYPELLSAISVEKPFPHGKHQKRKAENC